MVNTSILSGVALATLINVVVVTASKIPSSLDTTVWTANDTNLIPEEEFDFDQGSSIAERKKCLATRQCTNAGGSCIKSRAYCDGTVDPQGCKGRKCKCCIPNQTTTTTTCPSCPMIQSCPTIPECITIPECPTIPECTTIPECPTISECPTIPECTTISPSTSTPSTTQDTTTTAVTTTTTIPTTTVATTTRAPTTTTIPVTTTTTTPTTTVASTTRAPTTTTIPVTTTTTTTTTTTVASTTRAPTTTTIPVTTTTTTPTTTVASTTRAPTTTTIPVCGGEYNSRSGTIRHPLGGGNYQDDENCVWIIRAANPFNITFISFNTENGYDYLRVRDGASISGTSLGDFTGTNVPSPVQITSNTVYLRFTSDGSQIRTGFELTWGPTVPAGFEVFNGKVIRRTNSSDRARPSNYDGCMSFCDQFGAKPFIPRTVEDYTLYQTVRAALPYYMWLPANDRLQEGTLRWYNGEVVSNISHWDWDGQDLAWNSESNDCLHYGGSIYGGAVLVHMLFCHGDAYPPICEMI